MSWDFFDMKNPEALRWLWALVPLAILFALDLRRRRRALRLFISQSLLDNVSPRRSVGRPVFKFILLAAGLTSLVIAAGRPRWDPKQIELEQRGQNLLFCLDVSNSMRARDVDPSRLEAAKAAIRALISQLPAGNQVGLMAYAGDAELKCPLTPSYRHLLSVLDRVSYNSVGVGGSNLGDAVYVATREVFGLRGDVPESDDEDKSAAKTVIEAEQSDDERNANVLIVLTDGESHEGHAKEMAKEAHALGVGIYIIGLGTEEGAPIPIDQDGQVTMLEFKGQPVITKFDDASLKGVLEGLGDRSGYLAAGSANVDLVDIYNRVIARQGAERKKLRFTMWREQFQLFVGIGLALLVVSSLISDQRPAGRKGGLR